MYNLLKSNYLHFTTPNLKMKFFWPDPLDMIDPTFDFISEKGLYGCAKQQNQLFPHEIFDPSIYQGFVISKIYVDRGKNCRWNSSQLNRFFREGAKRFLRFPPASTLKLMGDSGAYTKASYDLPGQPLIDECLDVINFYNSIGVDYGLSPDNVISGFWIENKTTKRNKLLEDWEGRWKRTIQLAETFYSLHKKRGVAWTPIGVAQGWDPISYRESVKSLQQIGYQYIALGGLNRLSNQDILSTVKSCYEIKANSTSFHLLGISRLEHLEVYKQNGVISIDSSMPVRQAINDDRHNYHFFNKKYLAIRIPLSSDSPKMRRLTYSDTLKFQELKKIESLSLEILRRFDTGIAMLEDVLEVLRWGIRYRKERDFSSEYKRLLEDKPWKLCPCPICKESGIEVVILRNRERNLRRGFHNLFIFSKQIGKNVSF